MQITSPPSNHKCIFDEVVTIEWTDPSTPTRIEVTWDGDAANPVYVPIATAVSGTRFDWRVKGVASNRAVKVRVLFKEETAWLTQKALAELFGVKLPAISKHIFESGELDANAVVSVLESTALDGKRYATSYYNLDVIIAVGYRVNSYQATQFRIWATKVLREFIVKGFALDDERMKRGTAAFGAAGGPRVLTVWAP